jgi:hypothetical protein
MSIWIKEIKDSGKIIILDDSTKWEVSMFDRIDARMWMRMDSVTVKGNKMTNHSQRDKTISVKRLL